MVLVLTERTSPAERRASLSVAWLQRVRCNPKSMGDRHATAIT